MASTNDDDKKVVEFPKSAEERAALRKRSKTSWRRRDRTEGSERSEGFARQSR
jgi:hypothetical protein